MENISYPNRPRGQPKTDVQRVATHYGISEQEASNLLSTYSVNELLPPRGTGAGATSLGSSTTYPQPQNSNGNNNTKLILGVIAGAILGGLIATLIK